MPKNTKEIEERYYLDGLIKYFNQRGENSSILEFPIPSSFQKKIKDGDSVFDALIDHNGKQHWVEVVTVSRDIAEREEIGQERKGLPPKNCSSSINQQEIVINIGIMDDITKCSFMIAIGKKLNKRYLKCAEETGATDGILLIGFINRDPFFNSDSRNELLKNLKEELVFGSLSLQFAKSYFLEIYLHADVEKEGKWSREVYCVANAEDLQKARESILESTVC